MNNLEQQIDNLRTLQQSYDQIAPAVSQLAADVQAIKDAHILGFSYDGLIFEEGYEPRGAFGIIENRAKILEVHDSKDTKAYKITTSEFPILQVYDMPNIMSAGTDIFSSTALQKIVITNVPVLGHYPFYKCTSLKYLDILNGVPSDDYLFSDGAVNGAGSPNLILVKFGAGLTGSTKFIQIATNAYSNSSNSLMTDEEIAEHPTWHNLDMFLYNIREHIVANLPDRTGLSPFTLTLSQQTRNVLDQATEDAFAAKNWDIAPARS